MCFLPLRSGAVERLEDDVLLVYIFRNVDLRRW